jgi:hypothetical protein
MPYLEQDIFLFFYFFIFLFFIFYVRFVFIMVYDVVGCLCRTYKMNFV